MSEARTPPKPEFTVATEPKLLGHLAGPRRRYIWDWRPTEEPEPPPNEKPMEFRFIQRKTP